MYFIYYLQQLEGQNKIPAHLSPKKHQHILGKTWAGIILFCTDFSERSSSFADGFRV